MCSGVMPNAPCLILKAKFENNVAVVCSEILYLKFTKSCITFCTLAILNLVEYAFSTSLNHRGRVALERDQGGNLHPGSTTISEPSCDLAQHNQIKNSRGGGGELGVAPPLTNSFGLVTKLHPGYERDIFHILTSRDIADVIPLFFLCFSSSFFF